jgi:hypothetical protein
MILIPLVKHWLVLHTEMTTLSSPLSDDTSIGIGSAVTVSGGTVTSLTIHSISRSQSRTTRNSTEWWSWGDDGSDLNVMSSGGVGIRPATAFLSTPSWNKRQRRKQRKTVKVERVSEHRAKEGDLLVGHSVGVRKPAPSAVASRGLRGRISDLRTSCEGGRPVGQALGRGQETRAQRARVKGGPKDMHNRAHLRRWGWIRPGSIEFIGDNRHRTLDGMPELGKRCQEPLLTRPPPKRVVTTQWGDLCALLRAARTYHTLKRANARSYSWREGGRFRCF